MLNNVPTMLNNVLMMLNNVLMMLNSLLMLNNVLMMLNNVLMMLNNVPTMLNSVPTMLNSVLMMLNNVPTMLNNVLMMLNSLLGLNSIPTMLNGIFMMLNNVLVMLNSIPTMLNNVPTMLNNVPTMLNNVPMMLNNVPMMLNNVLMMLNNVLMMLNSIPTMLNNVPMILSNIPMILLAPSLSSGRRHLPLLLLLPLATSSVAPLLPPTLSAAPSRPFYYDGERLALVCTARTPRTVAGFRFFNRSGGQVGPRVLQPLPTAWLPLTAGAGAAGEYTCEYLVEDAGKEVPSGRSAPLAIEVRAAPTAPTFSLEPQQRIYRTGGSVTLLCAVPASPDYVREVQYYGDSGLAVSVPVWNARNCSYELRLAAPELSGSYSCAYFVYRAARPVRSGRSRWLRVTVKRQQIGWIRDAAVGGSFFTINGLIFLFTHLRMKRQERRD